MHFISVMHIHFTFLKLVQVKNVLKSKAIGYFVKTISIKLFTN